MCTKYGFSEYRPMTFNKDKEIEAVEIYTRVLLDIYLVCIGKSITSKEQKY